MRLTALTLEPAPPAPAEDDGGIPLWIPLLIPAAILVYYFGFRRFQATVTGRALEPRGRRWDDGGGELDAEFTGIVERATRRQLITPIAQAQAAPVMIRGTLVNADGNLGGAPGRECVWRNRAHARRDAAIGSEMVVIADGSGRAILENLERAQVIAPAEQVSAHHESVSLYLGDEVEVIGVFAPERHGEDAEPSAQVYGTLGADGRLHVRLHARPRPPASQEDAGESPPESSPRPGE
ncbi:MAG: hypothetical protein KC636_06390 [Myxococcales bacterium]|nr:hypothetical protein [Myxococcales bacterium]